jgi:hypothetical protein
MKRILRALRRDDGVTMVLVVTGIVVLSVLSTTLYVVLGSEQTRSNDAVVRDASFAAAEAGLHSYMAKLLDDSSFYSHYLAKGESTRRSSGGTVVAGSSSANVTWSAGSSWTYPNGFDKWFALGNGYEYSLQVTPPSSTTPGVDIVALGRKVGTTTDMRKLETIVRQASVTDFQMLADHDISYGSEATTTGKIYASQDAGGVKHDVNHDGVAYADIYAEGDVKGSVDLRIPSGGVKAKTYDKDTNPNIRTVIKSPISFASFLTSLADIQAAANAGGLYLNAPGKVWWLKFSSNGTFTTQQCTGSNPEDDQPTCGSASAPITIPSNGAVYAAQTAIVSNASSSGGVKGRVTVASSADVIVAANIGPVQAGVDVLGLVAANNMWVAEWCPDQLTWAAATIAQNGVWSSATQGRRNGTSMVFTGSTATEGGGAMNMFASRTYNYEPSLLYLQPPWFPVINDSLTTILFRELST